MIYKDLLSKQKRLSVIGLGYVGLPIALEFAKHFKVVGFDINDKRIEMMNQGIDPSKELTTDAFFGTDIQFTSDEKVLCEASFHIVAVPTPIDKNNIPDLTLLFTATETVAKVIKKDDFIVFESTVYPGATEEDCVPIIERISGLKYQKDFSVGYSPERINPGDTLHTLTKVVKVVSGHNELVMEEIARVYECIIEAGVHRAPSIKVAEAAKIIENTQRDLNIGLMNELSIIFGKMHINTYDVLDAAGTKWNFLKFYPGLVGGHCIGVDPYYLSFKASELGHIAQIITAVRNVNDNMAKSLVTELIKEMIRSQKNISKTKVLVLGITFKENVSDIRNSKIVDVVKELKSYGVEVDVFDPLADKNEVFNLYGISLEESTRDNYDAIIAGVAHNLFKEFDAGTFEEITNENAIFFDVKGIFRYKVGTIKYMSL